MKKTTKTKKTTVAVPTPVKHDSRICFGINYYASEAEADSAHRAVRERGDTYNGGFFHGLACGRDIGFDHVDAATGKKLYAVTVR
jgi:hypothetical protein